MACMHASICDLFCLFCLSVSRLGTGDGMGWGGRIANEGFFFFFFSFRVFSWFVFRAFILPYLTYSSPHSSFPSPACPLGFRTPVSACSPLISASFRIHPPDPGFRLSPSFRSAPLRFSSGSKLNAQIHTYIHTHVGNHMM